MKVTNRIQVIRKIPIAKLEEEVNKVYAKLEKDNCLIMDTQYHPITKWINGTQGYPPDAVTTFHIIIHWQHIQL